MLERGSFKFSLQRELVRQSSLLCILHLDSASLVMSQVEEMQALINFCGLPYIFFLQKSCNLWTVFIAQTGTRIGKLFGKEKETGTFLIVICKNNNKNLHPLSS